VLFNQWPVRSLVVFSLIIIYVLFKVVVFVEYFIVDKDNHIFIRQLTVVLSHVAHVLYRVSSTAMEECHSDLLW